MSVEPVLILIVIGVLANLLVMAAVLLPPLHGRRGLFEPVAEGPERQPAEPALAAGEDGPVTDFEADVPTWAYDLSLIHI